MKFDNTYYDWRGNLVELKQEEFIWFYQIVARFAAINEAYNIPILNRNHESMDGKHKNALGIFYTDDPKNPDASCYITIDNYHIHEQFEKSVHGIPCLPVDSVEMVIAHEIAHRFQFRHCKRHARITAEILRNYQNFYGNA